MILQVGEYTKKQEAGPRHALTLYRMPYLFGGLWVLILFGFMAAFFPYNSKVELGYGIVAALIFSGYILVDTQLVMRHYHVEEEIAAAISLYLDVINLFLAILRILNSQSNN